MAEDSSHTINAVFFKGSTARLGAGWSSNGERIGWGAFPTSAEGPESLTMSVATPSHCDYQKRTPKFPAIQLLLRKVGASGCGPTGTHTFYNPHCDDIFSVVD